MAHLYKNAKGFEVTKFSYSSGLDFQTCKKLFELKRIKGWRERKNPASLRFGEAIESAIQFYYANNRRPGSAPEEFSRLWTKVREVPNLTYTDKEGSWEDLAKMGREMMLLFEARSPKLPFGDKPKFQLSYCKEPFPGTELAGIEYQSFIDMRCDTPDGTPMIVDIKTAGTPLSVDPGLLALDPQLREYAWITGIQNVGFLWFTKARPSYSKGDEVSLLQPASVFEAGRKMIVLKANPETGFAVVLPEEDYNDFAVAAKGLKGKALEEKKDQFSPRGALVEFSSLTKTRLQFVGATIPPEDMREAGDAIGQRIAEVVRANEQGSWPKMPSVRFPNTKCPFCPMLPICSKNDKAREDKLYQIESTEEVDWLDALEVE